jgi:hypothetical protein
MAQRAGFVLLVLATCTLGALLVSLFGRFLQKLSEKWFEQHLKREFGGYKEDEMGRKVRFSALHRTAPRLARDFSDSFSTHFVDKGKKKWKGGPDL